MKPDPAAQNVKLNMSTTSQTLTANKTTPQLHCSLHVLLSLRSVFYWRVSTDWHVQAAVSDPRPEQRQRRRKEGGRTAAVNEKTDGQTEQPPGFPLQPRLQSDSPPEITAKHHTVLPMVQSAPHTHASREGCRALGWQRHYSLPHKLLPVFTTSDICCPRLHVWLQHLHW